MAFSIIIPSKTASNLVPCVQSISEAGETARVIVVDDGVDSEEMMQLVCGIGNRLPKAPTFIPVAKPFCFARNINIGIAAAGTDDVILLNDDTLLKTPRGFARMAEAMASRPHVGICAASCDTVGNPNQFRRSGMPDIQMRAEMRMVCFVCVYIPRSTIEAVGLLDEIFVGYGMDDDDYCLRVRNAGLRIGVYDGCFVDHGSLKSSYRSDPKAGGDFTGNLKLFIEKWGHDNWGNPRECSQWAHLFPSEGK